MSARIPPCGIQGCTARAKYSDACGVGYCGRHKPYRDCPPVSEDNPFDPWWEAATLAAEAGDTRFDNLEHGQWPADVADV